MLVVVHVLPQSPSDSTQTYISSSSIPAKLVTFNIPTLVCTGQKECLALALGTQAIDVCSVRETCIQESSYVFRLASPFNSSLKFYLRVSKELEASASATAGVGVAFSERAGGGTT